MGNVSTTRRKSISKELEKYCKPTGLYETCPWEERVVRRWIMEGQVAPRFPGVDAPINGTGTSGAIVTAGLEAAATAAATGLSAGRAPGGGSSAGGASTAGLAGSEKVYRTEECPICFMHYQGVNRTVCCSKPLCTECYLQVRPPRSSVVCPFCNCAKLNVTYLGPPSKEDGERRMAEEQRTIEARIRAEQEDLMRQAKERNARASSEGATTLGAIAASAAVPIAGSQGDAVPRETVSTASSFSLGPASSSAPSSRASLATVAERRLTEERIRNQHHHVQLPTSAPSAVGAASASATSEGGGGVGSSSLEHTMRHRRSRRLGRNVRRPLSGENDLDSEEEGQGNADGLGEQGEIQQVEDLMLMEALRLSVLEEQARRERSGDLMRRQAAEATAAAAATGGGGSSGQVSSQQPSNRTMSPPPGSASLSARLTSAYAEHQRAAAANTTRGASASPIVGVLNSTSSNAGAIGAGVGTPSWWEAATNPFPTSSGRAAADDSMAASFWRSTLSGASSASGHTSTDGAAAAATGGERLSVGGAAAAPQSAGSFAGGNPEGAAALPGMPEVASVVPGSGGGKTSEAMIESTGNIENSLEAGASREGGFAAGGDDEGVGTGGGGGVEEYSAELPESEEEQLLLAIELSLRGGNGSLDSNTDAAAAGRMSGGGTRSDAEDARAAIAVVAASESSASPFPPFAEDHVMGGQSAATVETPAAAAAEVTAAAGATAAAAASAGPPRRHPMPPEELMGWVAREQYRLMRESSSTVVRPLFPAKFPAPPAPVETIQPSSAAAAATTTTTTTIDHPRKVAAAEAGGMGRKPPPLAETRTVSAAQDGAASELSMDEEMRELGLEYLVAAAPTRTVVATTAASTGVNHGAAAAVPAAPASDVSPVDGSRDGVGSKGHLDAAGTVGGLDVFEPQQELLTERRSGSVFEQRRRLHSGKPLSSREFDGMYVESVLAAERSRNGSDRVQMPTGSSEASGVQPGGSAAVATAASAAAASVGVGMATSGVLKKSAKVMESASPAEVAAPGGGGNGSGSGVGGRGSVADDVVDVGVGAGSVSSNVFACGGGKDGDSHAGVVVDSGGNDGDGKLAATREGCETERKAAPPQATAIVAQLPTTRSDTNSAAASSAAAATTAVSPVAVQATVPSVARPVGESAEVITPTTWDAGRPDINIAPGRPHANLDVEEVNMLPSLGEASMVGAPGCFHELPQSQSFPPAPKEPGFDRGVVCPPSLSVPEETLPPAAAMPVSGVESGDNTTRCGEDDALPGEEGGAPQSRSTADPASVENVVEITRTGTTTTITITTTTARTAEGSEETTVTPDISSSHVASAAAHTDDLTARLPAMGREPEAPEDGEVEA